MLEHVAFDGDVEEGTGLYLEATVLLFAGDADELATSPRPSVTPSPPADGLRARRCRA